MEISVLKDIVDNYEEIKKDGVCYYDGVWSLMDNKDVPLQGRLMKAAVNCDLLVYEDCVVSHHAFLIYKLSNGFYYKSTKEFKIFLIKLIECLLQQRRFKSIKEARELLEKNGFKTRVGEKRAYACYWSNYKFERTLDIRDPENKFNVSFRYYGISENVTKKNMLLREVLRNYCNFYAPQYSYPTASRLNESKYYFKLENSSGYRMDKKLWEEDYEKFEKDILENIRKEKETWNN